MAIDPGRWNGERRRLLRNFAIAPFAAWLPLGSALAQKAARVAWLSPTRAADGSYFLDELRRGLRELGYVEGRNLVLDARWGDNSAERIEGLASEIVGLRPDVVVAQGAAALVMRKASSNIPIVFGYSGDPVEAGLVESLSRPGRNMTGISYMALELVGKRVELLKEVLPGIKRLAVVANPSIRATRPSAAFPRRRPRRSESRWNTSKLAAPRRSWRLLRRSRRCGRRRSCCFRSRA